jgi:hypothetical protein
MTNTDLRRCGEANLLTFLIRYDKQGNAKVLDFGLVKLVLAVRDAQRAA